MKVSENSRVPYICGPLTEVLKKDRSRVELFYEQIAGVCREILGVSPFVPHKYFGPVKHVDATPEQVDEV